MKNSLLEFTELLKNRLTDLLFEEAGNDKYIYLYLADGYWTAFEKSAYRLYRIYEPVMLHKATIHSIPYRDGKCQARLPVCRHKRADLPETLET